MPAVIIFENMFIHLYIKTSITFLPISRLLLGQKYNRNWDKPVKQKRKKLRRRIYDDSVLQELAFG